MLDLACSLLIVTLLVVALAAYGVRAVTRGEAHFARVDRAGASLLLGRRPMEMAYWALQPVGRACVRAGLTANAVTLVSLLLAAGAGGALALGHFGVAALLAAVASLGDALDGLVARMGRTVSGAGEVLDAAADRYSEGFFLGGLAIFYRGSVPPLLLVLGAWMGSYMVSYASAKAEGSHVVVPRGAMRRPERAVYLGAGAALVPIVAAVLPAGSPAWASTTPMLVALVMVATFANVGAILRLRVLARAMRRPACAPARNLSKPPERADDLATTIP